MTEPSDDARAEQAFRDALAREAEGWEPASPVAVEGKRRRWSVLGAAAAAVVIAAGGVVVTMDEQAPEKASVAVEPPQLGMRQVSYRDVVVSVPEQWGEGSAPTGAWCIGDDGEQQADTSQPYVAHSSLSQYVPSIGCPEADLHPRFDPQPERLWVPHLELLPAGEPDNVLTFEEWTLTTRTIGSVQLRLLTEEATTSRVDEIIGSAQQVDTDQWGCATTSPAQAVDFVRPPPFDVTAVGEVTSLAICQYDRLGTGEPGLSGSRELSGRAAQDLLEAIQAAPTGGGPDQPKNCAADMYGDQALVLRLKDGESVAGDLYVYYDWCFGNGVDDGTTRRALTAETCRPLFEGRVLLSSTSGDVGELCFPERR